jgi:protein gp37
MLTDMELSPYLTPAIELVVVGGESDRDARELDFAWVLNVRNQCAAKNVRFQFRQCGTHFRKEGKLYTLPVQKLCSQAKKAGIDLL